MQRVFYLPSYGVVRIRSGDLFERDDTLFFRFVFACSAQQEYENDQLMTRFYGALKKAPCEDRPNTEHVEFRFRHPEAEFVAQQLRSRHWPRIVLENTFMGTICPIFVAGPFDFATHVHEGEVRVLACKVFT